MSAESKEKYRELLIEIASEKFAKFGYKKTSLDDIVLATRKGKTAIYYYFKNKEEIFMAVVEKEAQILSEKIMNAMTITKTPEDKLRAYIFARMDALSGVSNFYDALKNEIYDQLSFIDTVREQYLLQEIELIKSIINDGINQNIFYVKNVELTSFAIVTALKGMEIPLFIKEKNPDIKQRMEAFLDILINGLRKRE